MAEAGGITASGDLEGFAPIRYAGTDAGEATDVTPSFEAAEALERANATLERRVRERTEELTRLNTELARAKSEAEDANISKTRFLAAASHDLLQPLHAARLYVTSLADRKSRGR